MKSVMLPLGVLLWTAALLSGGSLGRVRGCAGRQAGAGGPGCGRTQRHGAPPRRPGDPRRAGLANNVRTPSCATPERSKASYPSRSPSPSHAAHEPVRAAGTPGTSRENLSSSSSTSTSTARTHHSRRPAPQKTVRLRLVVSKDRYTAQFQAVRKASTRRWPRQSRRVRRSRSASSATMAAPTPSTGYASGDFAS